MNTTPKSHRGFTLIELLTVIAIIGILAAILIPTAARVRDSGRRAKCVSNVRQIAMSLITYANSDRQQRFPSNAGGNWAWDVRKDLVNMIIGTAGREVIYCPAGMPNQSDTMWSYDGTFAVSNYVLLVSGTPQVPATPEERSPLNTKLQQSYPTLVGTTIEHLPPSQRALVVDTVMRTGRDNYTDIVGGLQGNRTNHLSGNVAAGGNIAFVDGHVAWRPFDKMVVRTSGTPTFIW